MTEVSILVPVLDRPHRVRPLVDSIRAATPEAHAILFLADPHDRATQDAIAMVGDCRLLSPGGSYAHKINAGVAATSTPFVFLGADDLVFQPGWFPAAAALMSDTIGVVGTQDTANRRVVAGEHATHSLVARWYAELGAIDRPGQLLHEGYKHNFCDDELVATAKKRGAWAFAHDSVVEHHHPNWGTAPDDDVYRKGRAGFKLDRRLFLRRRRLWT